MNDVTGQIRVTMGSTAKKGAWTVPRELDVRVMWGNAELDLREAILSPGLTTFTVEVVMGNLEIVVPEGLPVQVDVNSALGNVEHEQTSRPSGDSLQSYVRIVGRVKLGNVEVMTLAPGESLEGRSRRKQLDHRDMTRQERHADRRRRHAMRRRRWHEIQAEKELWQRDKPNSALPWWLMGRMRRRTFSWIALSLVIGFLLGWHFDASPRWWHIVLAGFAVSVISGAIAWQLTRPLILVIRAARDIGDGKLDTRIDVTHHGGETRLLGSAINDMAEKIEKLLSDQRQLLAAVSHELRTPLGHMRVLIETARDTKTAKPLDELEKEVLVLDDLVGRLLASSRLEFGSLDRQQLEVGELVTDVMSSCEVSLDLVEAIGDVRAAIDPTLVRRAIANLLENARRHGGGAIAVRVDRRGAQVAIEVDDAGPGVAADRRADCFRAFGPSSGGGLGLGLALVSRIAVAHGGGAWITDRPGGGARVGFAVSVLAAK